MVCRGKPKRFQLDASAPHFPKEKGIGRKIRPPLKHVKIQNPRVSRTRTVFGFDVDPITVIILNNVHCLDDFQKTKMSVLSFCSTSVLTTMSKPPPPQLINKHWFSITSMHTYRHTRDNLIKDKSYMNKQVWINIHNIDSNAVRKGTLGGPAIMLA